MRASCPRSIKEMMENVEVIDVKLNNRKTKKIGDKTNDKNKKY